MALILSKASLRKESIYALIGVMLCILCSITNLSYVRMTNRVKDCPRNALVIRISGASQVRQSQRGYKDASVPGPLESCPDL